MQFNAIVSAEKILYAERKCIEPEFDYYKYQYEQWTNLEEVDDMRVQYAHSRMGEAYQSLLLVDTACAAAASAVLQTAKQCISMTWAGKDRFAKGRAIGSQYISAVIWHARNHALHFEEGWPLKNSETQHSLLLLQNEMGLNVDMLQHITKSLAYEIIKILGWNSYGNFANDMHDLLSAP
jgi:hypothetical protein